MNVEEARQHRRPDSAAGASAAHLSAQDVARLTNYKWRYTLEAYGFSSAEASRLLFVKWLYRRGAVIS